MSRGSQLQELVNAYNAGALADPNSDISKISSALTALLPKLLAAVDAALTAGTAIEDVQVTASSVLSDSQIALISNYNGQTIDSIDHEYHFLWANLLLSMFNEQLQVEISYTTDEATDTQTANLFIIRPL